MYPRLYCAVDGATHFALTDVRCQNLQPDAYSKESKGELHLLLHIVPIQKGESLADVTERILPGSTNIASRDHWFYIGAVMANDHSHNTEADSTTRLPPRKQPNGTPMKKSLSGMSDGRTAAVLEPYVDELIEKCKYDSKVFKPAVDTSTVDAKVFHVSALGLGRMPVIPTHFDRPLPGALWDEAKWGPFTKRLGMCIFHGCMRTGESNFEACTMLLRSIYAGKAQKRT